jgi:hypothetical protein
MVWTYGILLYFVCCKDVLISIKLVFKYNLISQTYHEKLYSDTDSII